MESNADIELEMSENSLSASPRPQRKNITIKLKQKRNGTGKRKGGRATRSKEEDTEQHVTDEEIIDTPIFKPMEPGEPLHKGHPLKWDHKVNLLGEKVVDPLIHCCEKCSLPILIYGRMIQCKHVFCFNCAKKTEKVCPRCEEPVQRIEQSALGTVFLCTFGGAKHGVDGCRRTYLSQRDLNAHIGHRHLKGENMKPDMSKTQARAAQPSKAQAPVIPQPGQKSLQVEQYTHSTRSSTAEMLRTSTAIPPRSSHEDMVYQRSQEMGHMQLSSAMVTGQHSQPNPAPQQMIHQSQVRQPPPHPFPQGPQQPPPSMTQQSMMAQGAIVQQGLSMAGLKQNMPPPQTSMIPQQQMPSVSANDSYTSSIPVMGGRTNLITVPIQDDEYRRKPEQSSFHPSSQSATMPSVPFSTQHPPPPIGHVPPQQQPQYPPVSMTPNIHQPPPTGLPISHAPPMFSSQSLQVNPMQNPINTSPMSHPPPGPLPHQRPGGPPLMTSALPPPMGPRPTALPPRITVPTNQPPPRFTGPPGHYEDSQNPCYGQAGQQHSPRLPWTGPPPTRGPPPPTGPLTSTGPMTHPPPAQRPPQSDYNQYY